MEEYLIEAQEELKRLEHIIYVSLKYTRTVDVIIGALRRMVGTYDLIIEAFLEKAKEEELIENLPKSPALRARRIEELYPEDKELKKYLTFYHFLKTVLKLPYEKRQEYRRHVAHIVKLENSTAEMTIDIVTTCEKYMHDFLRYAGEKLLGRKREEE